MRTTILFKSLLWQRLCSLWPLLSLCPLRRLRDALCLSISLSRSAEHLRCCHNGDKVNKQDRKYFKKRQGQVWLWTNVISARHSLQARFNYHLPQQASSLYLAFTIWDPGKRNSELSTHSETTKTFLLFTLPYLYFYFLFDMLYIQNLLLLVFTVWI